MDVIGVDPGPVTGIVRLRLDRDEHDRPWLAQVDVMQVSYSLVAATLDMLDRDCSDALAVAVERFVIGNRTARSTSPRDGEITRELVALIQDWATRRGLSYVDRRAADVKPWATDARLVEAGLLRLTSGMRHARDGARHALFCAVKTYGLPDPLSRREGEGL